MAFLRLSEARSVGNRESAGIQKAASVVIRESATGRSRSDIFLSQTILDQVAIVGVIKYLEAQGLSVYADWRDDPLLDRSRVDASTANTLREQMKHCDSLIYVWSAQAKKSMWMPWELGFFDGYKAKVAVLPLVINNDSEYPGLEYVAAYPTIAFGTDKKPYVDGVSLSTWIRPTSNPNVRVNRIG